MTTPTASAPPASVPPALCRTPRASAFVDEVREAVGRGLAPGLTADLVAERLALHLGAPDLLTTAQRQGDPASYRQHLLHAEPDGSFSVIALVWLPGQHTAVHDHVSWCVAGVHEGQERERRYHLVPDGTTSRLVAVAELTNPRGSVAGFAPPGDIHRVWNAGAGTAISIHVYGADVARLGSSVRRVYALPASEAL